VFKQGVVVLLRYNRVKKIVLVLVYFRAFSSLELLVVDYVIVNCINSKGSLAIVSCAHYIKYSLGYYIILLTNVYRNCYYKRINKCLLAHIPILDFLKINCKLVKLEEQENTIKAQ
jgi:hypothetical protein